MPEFFLELFSEEIPARMQARAAEDLARLLRDSLLSQVILQHATPRIFYGPRRLGYSVEVASIAPGAIVQSRGPKVGSPDQAIEGFLRKVGVARAELIEQGGYWTFERHNPPIETRDIIRVALPNILRRFPWPKSMRWGGTSAFTWVRPLRRIICLLDGAVVPFDLREGADDGHGLASANLTEGHRFHAPGAFPVTGCADWATKLRERRVLVDAEERKRRIVEGVSRLAAELQLGMVDDPGLVDEVAGLVEWPVPLLGRIDPAFMDLPPEVRQVSMRVNQRYFALRAADGTAAPVFAFVANIEPDDGGTATVAGNQRVLRARFADARHFWDLDRKTRLESLVPKLDQVTFHAKLGSQGDRVRRLEALAEHIAVSLHAGPTLARVAARAARLCKADLVTGMVGEFPELQGVIGRYYAQHDKEPGELADAIRDHYAPKGPNDAAPQAPVSRAVALADKLDQLAGLFAIGEKPTGSGDPYALRRAGLGIIRIIRENQLRLELLKLTEHALEGIYRTQRDQHLRKQREAVEQAQRAGIISAGTFTGIAQSKQNIPGTTRMVDSVAFEVVGFIVDRLRVQLRSEGARYDVLDAVISAHWDDDLIRLLARTDAVTAFLNSQDGDNLLTAYRRAANILRIEERKDGPHDAEPDDKLFRQVEEKGLYHLLQARVGAAQLIGDEEYAQLMGNMALLRGPLDAFFDKVTVNTPEPDLRRNRLCLLHKIQATMDRVADFSRLEG